MISANCTVYGRTVDEIKARAKMVMRPLYLSHEPVLTINMRLLDHVKGLWEADVEASWEPEPDGS